MLGIHRRQQTGPHVLDLKRTVVLEQILRRRHFVDNILDTILSKPEAVLQLKCPRVGRSRSHHRQKRAVHEQSRYKHVRHSRHFDGFGLVNEFAVLSDERSDTWARI